MKTRTFALIGGVMVVAALVSSCTTEPAVTPPASSTAAGSVSPTSTSASPTTAAPSTAAEADAMDAYRRYWAAQVASQADPTKPQDRDLAVYASGDALAGAQSTLLLFRQNGVAMRGEPMLEPTIGTPSDPTLVTINDCVDSTNWKPIYVKTGKSALAPGQAARVPVVSTVKLAQGRWVVTSSITQRDRTC